MNIVRYMVFLMLGMLLAAAEHAVLVADDVAARLNCLIFP